MAKVVCVLYDDPVDGYPKSYARDDIPKITKYPDGQTAPTPSAIDFKPGQLLGSVSGELGLRKFLEKAGHTLVVTSDKDGNNSKLDQELADAEIVISQPFWPAYMTAERIAKAPKLKMIVTAGIGSDHTDLQAAMDRGITVAEVTYCNCNSVAEHVVMMILALVRNYIPSYNWVIKGGWNIADCVARSYDLEGMHVGTVAAGRIGLRVLQTAQAARCPSPLHGSPPSAGGRREGAQPYVSTRRLESLTKVCDVVTLNCPLHPETEHMINDKTLKLFKRGAYLVNTARGKLCDRDAVVRALESGQLAGYAGDVWFPQPPPKDHPWRTMPHHGMTPHISGTSLLGADALCSRRARDPRVLLRGQADPQRVPDRAGRQARWRRRAFLQRRQRDRRIGGGGEVQEDLKQRQARGAWRWSRRPAHSIAKGECPCAANS